MQKTVRARVTPNSRKERVEVQGETLHVFVADPAEGNRANRRAVMLVARHFGVASAHVTLTTGQRSRTKRFVVTMNSY